MDIGSALTFMFYDRRWLAKLFTGGTILVGALLLSPALAGLGLIALPAGYMLETLMNVRDRYYPPLPRWWRNLGRLFARGLPVMAIWIVYNGPALLVSGASLGVNVASPILAPEAAAALGIVGICLGCVQFVLSLLGNALFPAALIHYARRGAFGAAFQFGEIIDFIRRYLGDYLITILVVWLLQIVALLGVIGFGVGVCYTFTWVAMAAAHLYGQLARRVATTVIHPRGMVIGEPLIRRLPARVGRPGQPRYNLLPPPGSRPM
jgi:hypothetical protein